MGYVSECPSHFVGDAGQEVGFEYELGEALVHIIGHHFGHPELQVQWVPVQAEIPSGPARNLPLFGVFYQGLTRGDF